jgi:amino acid adenylation domain-containing protein
LRAALDALLTRHEALRTQLRQDRDRLWQVVQSGLMLPLTIRDLRATGDGENATVEEVMRREATRPWNLAEPPLVRALLVRTDEDRHALLLAVHHCVCDGVSIELMAQQVIDGYRAALRGTEITGDSAPQFVDYVAWSTARTGRSDEDRRIEEVRSAQRAYWHGALDGAPSVLDMPCDFRRPARQSFGGARLPVRLPAMLVDRARGRASALRVTPASLFLSAYLLLLHRVSGTDDLLVGMPVANRPRGELSATVGYLANTLPLRSTLDDRVSVQEFATRTQRRVYEAIDNALVPFQELVDIVGPDRAADRNPVFQAMFGVQAVSARAYQFPGLTVEIGDVATATSRVDLSLFLFEEADGEVGGFLEYATSLFLPQTAQRFIETYLHLLTALLAAGEGSPVLRLPLPGAVGPWSGPAEPDRSAGALVWSRIMDQARRYPTAVAVRDADGELDYQALVDSVEQAAARLRAAGVGPGDRVVLTAERGSPGLVALIACWRAGGVWVPMDPALPPERRLRMLSAVRPRLVLVNAIGDDAGEPDPGLGSYGTLALDRLAHPGAEDASRPVSPRHPADPADPAYIMFTSGSTGTPKGVVVTHGNLASLLAALVRPPVLGRGDVLLALTTWSFDISLLELLGPLVCGATVDIAPASAVRDGRELASRLTTSGVSVAQATPAVWRLALEAGWEPPENFRVLCGGEALPADLAAAMSDRRVTMWNLYGPTETTIWSCRSEVTAEAPIRIGAPLAGTYAVVVDRFMQPVPVGIGGELLLGGQGVSDGYLGQPALTAGRFLPDSWHPGERLYRTGDLVRLHADGSLEYLGRRDEQVKIRGHRLELGEVDSALRRLPGVTDAASTVVGVGAAARIIGCLVSQPEEPGDEWLGEVMRLLRGMLPAASVPAELRIIDAIPLSPAGKIDRRAIGRVGRRLDSARGQVAPRNPVEADVTALWRELLERPDVGVTDDFFLLGGHSLLAALLMERLERQLGIRLPIADFFINPTVEQIAATASAAARRPPPQSKQDLAGNSEPAQSDWDFAAVRLRPPVGTSPPRPSD